ncbi:hypothetical protein GCM10011378_22760 [Hymenobacter glacieicola]|uniref:Uncharacterized protein n=1 Tax=Hymenobacter glacieicola TaxID=1562124 RepID=A0ABQ1WUB1_9BACT|nr:hypothetical protein GCM10011378_22760 [Hymenobacter glacieicola]
MDLGAVVVEVNIRGKRQGKMGLANSAWGEAGRSPPVWAKEAGALLNGCKHHQKNQGIWLASGWSSAPAQNCALGATAQ